MRGRYEGKKQKKRTGKIILIVVLTVMLVLTCAGVGAYLYIDGMLSNMKQAKVVQKDPGNDLRHLIATVEPEETAMETSDESDSAETLKSAEATVPEEKPMMAEDIVNILVVGQAARPGEESRMADSTVLVTINKYTKTVTLTSVLRDSLVKYPAYRGGNEGRCKFTTAYAYAYSMWDVGGAMEVLNLIMKQSFGVEVDYNFEIDMEMLMKLVNELDGVQMELTEAEAKYLNKDLKGYCELEAGYNSLDGYMALSFARMRKADGDGDSDIIRTARQRYLIERLIDKVGYKLGTEGLPAVQKLCTELLPYVITNMDNGEVTKLMLEVLPMVPDLTIEKGTCPAKCWGEMLDIYGDGQEHSVLRFDVAQNTEIMRAITEGELGE